MAYQKQTWHDAPATDSPINADRLNHMEDGIAAGSLTSGPAVINTDGNPGTMMYVGTTDPDIAYDLLTGDSWLDMSRPGAQKVWNGTAWVTIIAGFDKSVLDSIDPITMDRIDGNQPLHCYGVNFAADARILVLGAYELPTTVVDDTHVVCEAFPVDGLPAGPCAIQVRNPGFGNTNALELMLTSPPAPVVESVNPTTIAFAPGQNFTVVGSNFSPTDEVNLVVNYSDYAVPTTYVDGNTLEVIDLEAQYFGPGLVNVKVRNQIDDWSNDDVTLMIDPPPGNIDTLSPNTGVVGVNATINVIGDTFNTEQEVCVDGVPIPTTFLNNAALHIQYAPTQVGVVEITVRNTIGTGAVSNALPFTVTES